MAKVRVKTKIKGIRALLKSAPVHARVVAEANAIRDRAGDGFGVAVVPHEYTPLAYVQTETRRAMKAEAVNKALTRAVGGSS